MFPWTSIAWSWSGLESAKAVIATWMDGRTETQSGDLFCCPSMEITKASVGPSAHPVCFVLFVCLPARFVLSCPVLFCVSEQMTFHGRMNGCPTKEKKKFSLCFSRHIFGQVVLPHSLSPTHTLSLAISCPSVNQKKESIRQAR